MPILKRVLPLLLMALFSSAIVACEKEGPAERAGKKLDETVEKMGEKIEEAGDKVKDATQK